MRSNLWRSRGPAVGSRQSALTTDNRSACGGTTDNRRGFTLVELLVVIVIIIILMGLLTPVLILALARARDARIMAEVGNLDSAIKSYKERYGTYPPSDFSNLNTNGPVAIHLQKAFPRCNITTELQWISQNSSTYGGNATISPAQAMVFWLYGFTSDVEHPLSGITNGENLAATPLFPFEQTRVTMPWTSGAPAWAQRFGIYTAADGLGAPYVYFAAQNYLNASGGLVAPFPGSWTGQGSGQGTCRPYFADTPNNGANGTYPVFANANSFQIISAGQDGNYGNGDCSYPSGGTNFGPSGVVAYGPFDADNITNFSSKTMGDAVPQ